MSKVSAFIERIKRLKGPIAAIAAGGAILSGMVGYYTTYKTVAATATSVNATAPDQDAINPLSIMVLPFANQTGDVAKGYVADGLTSNITSDLSRIRDAVVMAPAQAYAYKDKAANLKQIGREAGVRFIVQGALQASAEQVRVAVHLADADTGAMLWSETIEGTLTDIFSLQDTVTQRVSANMGPAMIVSAARASDSRKSNLRAVDAILRAKAEALQPVSLESYHARQKWYRKALDIEPDNVSAQLGLAGSLIGENTNFSSQVSAAQSTSLTNEAQDLANRAFQREPDSPRALGVLWAIARNPRDCPRLSVIGPARLALEPNNPGANGNYGMSLALVGHPSEGLVYVKRGVELNPRRPGILRGHLGATFFLLQDHASAISWLQRAIQDNPKFPDTYAWLALAYELQGDKAQVKATLAKLHDVAPGFRAKDMDEPGATCSQQEKDFWQARVGDIAARVGIPP